MLAVSRANAARTGATSARFLHGHIEDIPLPARQIDVVISNCVVSLSADKARVLAEAFRVLRPGGRLGISDVIADDGIDPGQSADAEQCVGCISGTLTRRSTAASCGRPGSPPSSSPPTSDVGGGLHSPIIQAARPAIAAPAQPAIR